MGNLAGRVAVVTGAGSGNGRAMARRFAAQGASVVVADVDEAGLEESGDLIRQAGGRVLPIRCDVARKADLDAMFDRTVSELGGVDIAVANAGVVESETDCLRITEEQWDRVISVNLRGVFFTLQGAAKRMIRRGRGGRLIAIASIMAEWGGAGTPAYCASKGGVRQLVRSFAIATGRFGITCNAIAPGFIDTAMTRMIKENPMMAEGLIDRTPVGRIGDPSDVANVAAFLASDESSFVSGTILFSDGGITAGLYSAAAAQLAQATVKVGVGLKP
jgi:glucose 1-dehydrogenase